MGSWVFVELVGITDVSLVVGSQGFKWEGGI